MRLIDADALKENLEEFVAWYDEHEQFAAMETVDNAPTIDAAPVVRGKWKQLKHKAYGIYVSCSECGNMEGKERNYCPNCGACMKEV